MQHQVIRVPQGLYYTKNNASQPGYCDELLNIIPSTTNLSVRKGILKLSQNLATQEDPEFQKFNYIATYSKYNIILLFSDDGIYAYYPELKTTVKIFEQVLSPINYIETNSRVILFFKNNQPVEIFFNGIDFSIEQLAFTPEETTSIDFTNFSNACRYREVLYYYKQGENKIYYTIALGYKGELTSYDLTGIFNTKGDLAFLAVLGYSAGSGVSSNLVAVFKNGDVLVLDGLAPDIDGWKVLTQISLNTEIYSEFVEFGTNVFCLSKDGLIDLQVALKTDNIVQAKALSNPLLAKVKDWSKVSLFKYSKYLVLTQANLQLHFLLNTETFGYSANNGYIITHSATLSNNHYMLDSNGYFYITNTAENDDGAEILAIYKTSWFDLGNKKRKHLRQVTLDLDNVTGNYDISCDVLADYNAVNKARSFLPKTLNSVKRWDDIKNTWTDARTAFFGNNNNAYNTITFNRTNLGRTLQIEVKINTKQASELVLTNLAIDYLQTST